MATPPPPPPLNINLWVILSESKSIIKAHSRHFLALSVLFLLPLSFSCSVYPVINQLFSQSSSPTIESHRGFLDDSFQQDPPIFPIKTLIFNLLYALFNSLFSLFATGSITYSVFHGFYGRPVKLVSAVKSAFTSFFPLVSTRVVWNLILSGIFLILGLVIFVLIEATTQLLGFRANYSSSAFISLFLVFLIIFMFIGVYSEVNWILAYVVVVVESRWGLEPLKRSQILVKGMKGVAFSMLLFFGSFTMIVAWGSTVRWGDAAADKWKSWAFVIDIVITSSIYMLLLLYSFAAQTVFYIHSKAIHGEPAGEIADEFACEYVSLPFDDGKVPRVVSIV